jgi:hypothetical protein
MPVLVVYLDPVSITLQCPPTRARELADFCRELAHEAARLAAEIDPDGEPAPPEAHFPRHALVYNEFGESGAGHWATRPEEGGAGVSHAVPR